MEANYKGKIVAIDQESGEYFIGDTGIEASKKGKEKYPGRIFSG